MNNFFSQIKNALDADLYHLALFGALAVPDICGAISSEDGKATGQKYKNWFNKYVSLKYLHPTRGQDITGEDCYRFRCSMLHQGTSHHVTGKYSRFIFVEHPSVYMHCTLIEADGLILAINTSVFCDDILGGAETWITEYQGTEVYKRNIAKFMRHYPEGLAPVFGVPVIG